jgi:hypothetical protein
MGESSVVGELVGEDEALDVSDSIIESSLILVWSGTSILIGRSVGCSEFFMWEKCMGASAPVDFEHGDSSIGVTLIRDEGESKDCERMRTLGEGVRGGTATVVAILEAIVQTVILNMSTFKQKNRSQGLGEKEKTQSRPREQSSYKARQGLYRLNAIFAPAACSLALHGHAATMPRQVHPMDQTLGHQEPVVRRGLHVAWKGGSLPMV